MRITQTWRLGEWTFVEVTDHGFGGPSEGRLLYGFTSEQFDDIKQITAFYPSLDYAMASAIAEKHTGRCGAGGTGVGTAADWFMRMIGAGQIQEAGPEGARALMDIVREHGDDQPLWAHKLDAELQARGFVLARQAIDW